MATAAEAAAGGNSELQIALDSALQQLSKNETVTFTQYTRLALSPDSSVFWIANSTAPLIAEGSLHIAVDRKQNEDETLGLTTAIFTSEELVTQLTDISPTTMWIGSWKVSGTTLQVAFSTRGRFYQQAKIWHYVGVCVNPAMQSQIIASPADLPTGPIVSNSLPIWLLQTTVGAMTVPAYSSYLLPDNIVPPYIVAHVEPGRTTSLQGAPIFQQTAEAIGGTGFFEFSASQLARDEVRLTMYGFTNAMAWQFYWTLYQYSLVGKGEPPTFGFADSPAFQDEKRTQSEIATIAMKKTLTFQANYYQGTANAAAYRLILNAMMSIQINGGLNPIGIGNVVQADQTVNAVGTVT